jgi:MFS family permease
MFGLGIILSYVVLGYIAILFFFGTIYTLPMELFVPVLAPFIIAMTAGIFSTDLVDKLDEDPRAGGKILVCGLAVFIAAFWVIMLILWLGSLNLLAFLPMYLFVMTVLVPNMVLFFLIGGLFFIAGYRIRFAPISSEPVPPLPNRNRIIALLGGFAICYIAGLLFFPGRIVDFWTEIRSYFAIFLWLFGFGLGFAAAIMYDFASKNRYDPKLMHEIHEDVFVCPLCHTAIKPSSFRCYKCFHLIPDSKGTF